MILWHRWPSYDFIFGVPHRSSSYYGKEAAFFQYRDTRIKKVQAGFYVDRRELTILTRGFCALFNVKRRA